MVAEKKTGSGDVDMFDAQEKGQKGKGEGDMNAAGRQKKGDEAKTVDVDERLKANVRLIEYAVKQKEPKLLSSRLLRQTQAIRRYLNPFSIEKFVEYYLVGNEECLNTVKESLEGLDRVDGFGKRVEEATDAMETEGGSGKNAEIQNDAVKGCLAEAEIYAYLVTCMYLVDVKQWDRVIGLCDVAIGKANQFNIRTIDSLSARLFSYLSLAAERLGRLSDIRGPLLQLHRAAVLRHDSIGQETLLILLLRNYLAYNLYSQAEALRAKAQPDVIKSSGQHCRLLYYHGRIQAVLLEYTDAKEALVQAARKAPHSARGFRLQVAKWLVVVRLLLGEVPSRSELAAPDLRPKMGPYFDLAKAVGAGDVNEFYKVADKYKVAFQADGLQHVVARLKANVIRSGVRRIATAYSRISLSDVAHKLGLPSVSDAEYIVAKAIRDGGITAVLDHEAGTMTCSSYGDVYSTDEPLNAFHARIAFCLDVHNEAQKAIRHDQKSQKEWDDANAVRERQEQELQAALEDDFDL